MGLRRVGGVTAWAGACLLGLLLVSPDLQEGSPGPHAVGRTTSTRDPWASSLSFEGRLAAQVCAPNGVESCTGLRQGEHHDLHMVAVERTPSSVTLELEWDATSASSRELVLWLDGVVTKQSCDDCSSYRFRVLGKTQGVSPLRLTVPELDLRPGEGLAVLVRIPDELPQPVMAQARPAQPFAVTGTMNGA